MFDSSILMAAANGTNPLNNLGLQIDPSRKEFSFAALSVITQMSSEIR